MSHAEGRLATIGAAVLTGGASERMGRDKARLEIGGAPFATRIARLLEPLFEDVALVGGDPPADAPGRRVADADGPRCALRGLATALAACPAEQLLVVATDLPLVTPDLLLGLVARPEADAVVPRTPDGSQPLCALYRCRRALPLARAQLAAGRLALHPLLDALETDYVEGDDLARLDPAGSALLNVNTPEDLARARARLPDARG